MIAVVRASTVAGWTHSDGVLKQLRERWPRRPIELPAYWPAQERDEAVDVLAAFTGLPLRPWTARNAESAALFVVSDERDDLPRGSVALREVPSRDAEPRVLSPDRTWWSLRDAVIECVRREFAGTEVEQCIGPAQNVADTPVTSIWFFDSVVATWSAGERDADALCDAGMASVLRRMIVGGDAGVAEWMMAYAFRGDRCDEWVDVSQRVRVDRAGAVQLAFEWGWVSELDRGGAAVTLRPVFTAVASVKSASRLDRIAAGVGLTGIARVLDRAARALQGEPYELQGVERYAPLLWVGKPKARRE
jgi:hypothetical protein